MLKNLIFFTVLFASVMLSAQDKQQNFIIKTNVLNIVLRPSLHLEYRIANKSSIALNFHRGTLYFFNDHNWVNASVEIKRYFSKKTNLTGFYLAPGISYNHNYEEHIVDDAGNILKSGISSVGGILRLGYQFGLGRRWILDLGTGLVIDKEIEANYDDNINAEMRLMLGVGYKF